MRAYERCWFFGDFFGGRSFEKHFQARSSADYNGYTKANFDTSRYFHSGFLAENPSMVARMSNLMSHALQVDYSGKLLLPPKTCGYSPRR